jgi:hypothetical protein
MVKVAYRVRKRSLTSGRVALVGAGLYLVQGRARRRLHELF